MLSQPKVLLISSDEVESRVLERILREHVALRRVGNLSDLRSNLEGGNFDAVFCGWSFHRDTWNDALGQIQRQNPDLPVVIFFRSGGEKEWADVLEAGAFDLLAPPYEKPGVLAVLEQAVESYQARRSNSVSLETQAS